MDKIVLTAESDMGEPLSAIFLPSKGMNLISYKKGAQEVIDSSTANLFEERFAGLGSLIGPHFHRHNPAILPPINDESLFPHIARVRAQGIEDPFTHGIARYAPWQATSTQNSFKATLTGKDVWNGVPLAALEGQNFTMHFEGELTSSGLHLSLDVVSDTDSVVGLHYYYHLPKGEGSVRSEARPFPSNHTPAGLAIHGHQIKFDLSHDADFTFHPYPNTREGVITLDAIDYQLITRYSSPSEENSWQLYHPKDASFVCIEPISAFDPRHPNLSVSSLKVSLEIKT